MHGNRILEINSAESYRVEVICSLHLLGASATIWQGSVTFLLPMLTSMADIEGQQMCLFLWRVHLSPSRSLDNGLILGVEDVAVVM